MLIVIGKNIHKGRWRVDDASSEDGVYDFLTGDGAKEQFALGQNRNLYVTTSVNFQRTTKAPQQMPTSSAVSDPS